jgi:NTE family protein
MATTVLRAKRSATSSDASHPRTAFVLSGGASLGALQAGMLQALYEHDVLPDVLVGTSVGALNAAFIASRPQTTATARELARVWHGLEREDIFPVSLSALVGGICGRRDHLVPEHGLRRLVRRYVEFDDLADARVPLHVVTFDLAHGREVLLSRGPAVESILAAASIPGVFPPVALGDGRLVDGGVVNNTPISHAVELGAERIYVLPTGDPSDRRLAYAPKTALDAAIQGVALLVQSRLEADIARYSRAVELIVLPAPNPRGVQPTSFEHSAHLIVEGRHAAHAALTQRDVATHLRLAG